MHIARYTGNFSRKAGRTTMLCTGQYYQMEYSVIDDVVDVLVYPIRKTANEYWEGHVEYETLQDAFDDWDDICREVRDLKPFSAKKRKIAKWNK